MKITNQFALVQSKSRYLETKISEYNRQIRTGTKAKDLADIGQDNIEKYSDSKFITGQTEQYIGNIESLQRRFSMYDTVFEEIQTLIDSMDVVLDGSKNVSDAELADLSGKADGFLKYLEGLLHTKEDQDTYLFHGQDGRASWDKVNLDLDNNYGAKEKILDEVEGASAAYSLRQLDKDYTGSAIRLRRDGDNAEMDFGFDENGDLNTDAITAWLGGADGYVTTWYDQSGNGNDGIQMVDNEQPELDLSESKASIQFGGTSVHMMTEDEMEMGSVFATAKYDYAIFQDYDGIFTGEGETSSYTDVILIGNTGGNEIRLAYDSIVDKIYINDIETTTPVDITEITQYTATSSAPKLTKGTIGFDRGSIAHSYPNRSWDGDIYEIIVYSDAVNEVTRKAVDTDAMEYWGINGSSSDISYIAFPDLISDPLLTPDVDENLSPYNYEATGGLYDKGFETYKPYDVAVNESEKIEANYTAFEPFIQNLVYALDISRKALDANESFESGGGGASLSDSIAEAKKFLTASNEQFSGVKKELVAKQTRLEMQKKLHTTNLDFYKSVQSDIDASDDDANIAMILDRLYLELEMSYATTTKLSMANIMGMFI